MGGQACVFYGAAQVSKDIDILILSEPDNLVRLEAAIQQLQGRRIAVPPFSAAVLDRGHAVHFRCDASGVQGLRVDVMSRLRASPDFAAMWERRTTFVDETDLEYHLLCVPDLVHAKKTQRSKDWPVIELLVTIHYRENMSDPSQRHIDFWFREARSAELLVELCRRFPEQMKKQSQARPLISLAAEGVNDELRAALDAEVRAEQAKDRAYWEPLRRELEQFRRDHRDGGAR